MTDTLAAIQEFTELAVRRIKGDLAVADRARLEALEDELRDQIDGAHPAPRRLENPTALKTSTAPSSVKPAQIHVATVPPKVSRPASAPTPAELTDDLTVGETIAASMVPSLNNEKDRAKLNEVSSAEIPASGYTPPSRPPFLEDYYSGDIERPRDLVSAPPSRAVIAEGEETQLLDEVRLFFGVSQPPARATDPSPRRRASTGATAAVTPLETAVFTPSVTTPVPARSAPTGAGPPAVVHLLSSSSKRGELLSLDDAAGWLVLRHGGQDEQVALAEVFAVFVGVVKGAPVTPQSGTRIGVKLSNGKELVGASPDYAPGAGSMTLIPDDRRTVDRVWIPAWSVTEIRLA